MDGKEVQDESGDGQGLSHEGPSSLNFIVSAKHNAMKFNSSFSFL